MILELERGAIHVKQNSCEKVEQALIYIKYLDGLTTDKTNIQLFINDKLIDKINVNTFEIKPHVILESENKVSVVVTNGYSGDRSIYTQIIKINQYISFGELDYNKAPQMILDLKNEMLKLEIRIKELESKNRVI